MKITMTAISERQRVSYIYIQKEKEIAVRSYIQKTRHFAKR